MRRLQEQEVHLRIFMTISKLLLLIFLDLRMMREEIMPEIQKFPRVKIAVTVPIVATGYYCNFFSFAAPFPLPVSSLG